MAIFVQKTTFMSRPHLLLALFISAMIFYPDLTNARHAYPGDKHMTIKGKLQKIIENAAIPMIQVAFREDSETSLYEANSNSYNPPAPNNQTVFQAASLSKTIFASIVLRMAREGRIDMNKPLAEYMPNNRVIKEQQVWAGKLTAAMVLSHKTGLPNWSTSPSSESWPGSQLSFRFAPDSAFSYSGEGYYYLQQVVEAIQGKTLQEIARQQIFEPLGMTNSNYGWKEGTSPFSDYEVVAAHGFDKEGNDKGKGRHPRENCAYTLRTTAQDYSLFLDALFSGRVTGIDALNSMINPLVKAVRYPGNERLCDKNIFWGLGIGMEKHSQFGTIYFHWGDNGNFRALFIVVPSKNSHLVYFTNSYHGHSIIDTMTNLFFGSENPFELSAWVNQTP